MTGEVPVDASVDPQRVPGLGGVPDPECDLRRAQLVVRLSICASAMSRDVAIGVTSRAVWANM